jgi:hypothetical protein
MVQTSACWARVGAGAGLWVLAVSGCFPDFDALTEGGKGGGNAVGTSGSSIGGSSIGAQGATGAAAGDEASAGEAMTTGGSRPMGGGGGNGNAGTGAVTGTGGDPGTCDEQGLTSCPDTSGCTDLALGNVDGDSVLNCGECGTSCSLTNASSAECSAAVCKPTCDTDFGDCNAATANDGCEADLKSKENCGACKYACSNSGTSETACTAGRCEPTCAPKYADCNGDDTLARDDGCEVYFDSLDACLPLTSGCSSSGVACDPNQVCNDGLCVAADGVAVLSVPLPSDTAPSAAHRFADLFPAADLRGAFVTVRIYAPGATGGTLVVFLSDTLSAFGPQTTIDLSQVAEGWMDIEVPLGGINAMTVKQVNIEVHATGAPWTDPTVLYVDGVRSSNQVVNHKFDATFENFVNSSQVKITGASIGWAAAVP